MGRLNVDFPKNIARFEAAMKKKFSIKTIFYQRIFRGKGPEFDSFRKYSEDDDASLIDWKVSMRTGELLVKKYIEERNLKIFFIIDVGESMVLGSGENLKNEIAAEIAAALAHLVVISGDEIGFALYSDRVAEMRMFCSGIRQFYLLEKNLKRAEVYRGKSDLKKNLKYLMPYLKDVLAVFIISDFLNLDEESLKTLREFLMRYETIGIMVRDLIDIKLPDLKKEIVIEDIYTGKQMLINPSIIKEEYEKNAFYQKRKIEEAFKKTGSDLVTIQTDKDFIKPLTEFLKLRVKLNKIIVPVK